MKRLSFIGDGTAVRKCPSTSILDMSHPRELYTVFDEAIGFITWITAGSKILSAIGQELLQTLHSHPAAEGHRPDEAVEDDTKESLTVFEYAGNQFTMKIDDGRYMVNATEMARPFEKRPTTWLKLAETVKLRAALTTDGICRDTEGQVESSRGAYGATWFDIHLCIPFAQWLSPEFATWCSRQLASLMNTPLTAPEVKPRKPVTAYEEIGENHNTFLPAPTNYEEALSVIDRQREALTRQGEFLRENRHKFEHYQQTVETREWFCTTMIANEIGVSVIKLNQFLADEGIQTKRQEQWAIEQSYRHLRDIHIYEWFNHKTNYTNKYKVEGWTPAGREFIIELWREKNS
jgi:phage antirepressor YoqD-like protein